ncbi:MAG: hypothetical protein AB1523_16470 [Bacillota bacterium]
MPAIPLPLAKFQKQEALCWSCLNATTGCPFFFFKDPLAGLEAAGATAYILETKDGILFKVVRCPNFTKGRKRPRRKIKARIPIETAG